MLLKEKIPEIYHSILQGFLDIEVPTENLAPCSTCNLCQSEKSPYIDSKCCNYFPEMPNYLLGGILQDKELEQGINNVNFLISNKTGVDKFGIVPDKNYVDSQAKVLKIDKLFNSKEELNGQKCPYLVDAKCSIWKYREHLCVSFFCSTASGKSGREFWKTMDEFLNLLEKRIAKYCELNIKDPTLEIQEYFLESFRLVQKLKREDLIEILGDDYSHYLSKIKMAAAESLINTYPEILRLKSNLIYKFGKNDTIAIQGTKVIMDSILAPLIKLYDGKRTTKEVFYKAHSLLINMNSITDQLIEEKLLIEV